MGESQPCSASWRCLKPRTRARSCTATAGGSLARSRWPSLFRFSPLCFSSCFFGIDGYVSDEGRALLDRLDVGGLLAHLPHECSLGQNQRVAIARALLTPTRFLLLDEPSSALDRSSQKKVLVELAAAKQARRGLVIVTHDERSFDSLADQRLLLEDGRLRPLAT